MKKYKNVICVVIVVLLFAALTFSCWALPSKDFSDSERRKLNTRVTRAEAEIEQLDALIEEKTAELTGLTDYQKAMDISTEIEEFRAKQEQAMQAWEEASLALEEFDK